MRDRPLHGVAVYNPDLLSKDELIELFCARATVLDRLIDDIRREGAGAVQHHLLVGRRGMGKTTLLRRLAHAIDDDATLAATWVPLTFPEEQYNVAHLSDFWLNCLDALGDRLERRGDRERARQLDAQIESIAPLTDEKHRHDAALALLEETAAALGRRLVLLVDNVDLILDRIKADEWSLRATLSSAEWLLLIGATAVGLESTYDYEAAFYDFFRVHALRGLDEDETFALLRRLAETFDAAPVIRVLDEQPGRIRALRVLAGGNPRTLVLLFTLLAQGIDGDVRSDLERLLDHCTPLYKARFENLTPQQQHVVDAMAVHWHPITAGDLAARLRMDVNKVSSQLNRLVRDGVVEKVEIHGHKRAGFQLAERFFNIWYLMRASRRVRRHLVWLVEFLRLMYAPAEHAEMARRHLAGAPAGSGDARLNHAENALALAAVVQSAGLRYALESQGLRTLAWDPHLRRQLGELLDLHGADAPLADRAERMKMLAEVREWCLSMTGLPDGYDGERLWRLIGGSIVLRAWTKHRLISTSGSRWDMPTALLPGFEEMHRREDAVFGDGADALRDAAQMGEIDGIHDSQGILAVAQESDDPHLAAIAYGTAVTTGAVWPGAMPSLVDDVPYASVCHDLGSGEGGIAALERAWQTRWSRVDATSQPAVKAAIDWAVSQWITHLSWEQAWPEADAYETLTATWRRPLSMSYFVALRAVVSNAVAAALAALDATPDLSDRWRPLREALAAIDAGTRAYLTRVAPEIREPADQIIDRLAPELPA